MNDVFLILGSNIEKEKNLPTAVAWLRERCQVMTVAGVYETAPVGLVEQPVFWNTAVHMQTPFSPAQIKDELLTPLEQLLNRVRQADKNAPRTIDADIVLFNDEVFEYVPGDGRARHIPDPDLLKFPHVAAPVAELAPDMLHPETGERLAHIAGRLVTAVGGTPIWKRDDIQI